MFMRDIYDANVSWSAYVNTTTYMIQQASTDPVYPLVYFQGPDFTSPNYTQNITIWQQAPYITDLRYDEYSASIATSATGVDLIMIYSTQQDTWLTSLLSIMRTLFVCVVLTIASVVLTNDANTLVLNPIERMLEVVKVIANNPLAAASDEVQKSGMLSVLDKMNQDEDTKDKRNIDQEVQYETSILENAILKIGHLLAVGFGEAGAKILSANIKNHGDVDPMIAG